jgi:hypothetical protein
MTTTLDAARAGGPLVPPTERVLQVAVPDRLWRVRLDDGRPGWWKRAVTPAWRRPLALNSHSRARREHDALRLLRQRGLPAPEPVGWRERRRGPALLESALLTLETPELVRLDLFLRDERAPALRAAALHAAGDLAARIHARGIGHFRLLPKNVHVSRVRPERAWILDAPNACAWTGSVPRRVRDYDLCTLAGPSSGLAPLEAEAVLDAYEQIGGTVIERKRLICAPPCRMKLQRIAFYLEAVWTRHRPEAYLGPAAARAR